MTYSSAKTFSIPSPSRLMGFSVKVGANEETLLQKHFDSMLLAMLHGCGNGKEAKQFQAFETKIPRLQDMLFGYANEETLRKHSK